MRLIDADELKKALAEMWYENNIRITGLSVAKLIDNAPTIEPSGDLVSRQLLIGAIEKCGEEKIYPQALIETIKALPSAECPQNDTNIGTNKKCDKCFYKSAIKDYELFGEAEPSDLISREEAIEIIASHDETNGTEKVFTGREITDLLATLPSADRPHIEGTNEYNLETIADIVRQLGHLDSYIADTCDRPQGEWEQAKYVWECSNCGYMAETPTHYCPSCGTRMAIPITEHKEEDNND